jgi:hypothetical protein
MIAFLADVFKNWHSYTFAEDSSPEFLVRLQWRPDSQRCLALLRSILHKDLELPNKLLMKKAPYSSKALFFFPETCE